MASLSSEGLAYDASLSSKVLTFFFKISTVFSNWFNSSLDILGSCSNYSVIYNFLIFSLISTPSKCAYIYPVYPDKVLYFSWPHFSDSPAFPRCWYPRSGFCGHRLVSVVPLKVVDRRIRVIDVGCALFLKGGLLPPVLCAACWSLLKGLGILACRCFCFWICWFFAEVGCALVPFGWSVLWVRWDSWHLFAFHKNEEIKKLQIFQLLMNNLELGL